jgi:hypothetical protein
MRLIGDSVDDVFVEQSPTKPACDRFRYTPAATTELPIDR